MERDIVASSNLASVGYDRSTEILEVEFLDGSIYQYFNVPQSIYEQLMQAPSKGGFLNSCIKGIFAFSRVN